jgi:serine/threonine protein kinase
LRSAENDASVPYRSLDRARWEKLKRLFDEAKHLRGEKLQEFLALQGMEDASTADQLKRLVQAHRRESGLLDRSVPERLRRLAADGSEAEAPEPVWAWCDLRLDGRYVLREEIGRGGSGRVWRALDERLMGRPVVVKFLPRTAMPISSLRGAFESEIQALSCIDDPGVARPLDLGSTPEGTPFLVLEYVAGDTLREHLRRGSMGAERTARLIRQVARALDEVHRVGVWHLDLKPDNIVLHEAGRAGERAVIVDFGIAKLKDSVAAGSAAEEIVGSPAYMAPEQFEGQACQASDMYSLAMIAVEMLTGETQEISGNHAAHLSSKARKALARALDPDPQARHASASAFAAGLEAALLPNRPWRNIAAVLCVTAVLALSWLGWTKWKAREGRSEELSLLLKNAGTIRRLAQLSSAPGAYTTDLLERSVRRMRDLLHKERWEDLALREALVESLLDYGSELGDPERRHLGNTKKALELTTEAVREADDAAAVYSNPWPTRRLAAEARARLASVLIEMDAYDDAEPVLQDALSALSSLRPGDPNYWDQFELRTRLLSQMSRVTFQRKQYDECLRQRDEVVANRRALTSQRQTPGGSEVDLGVALGTLGYLKREMGRPGAALRDYGESDSIFERLRLAGPANVQSAWYLARNAEAEGVIMMRLGSLHEAHERLQSALDAFQKLHHASAEDASSTRAVAVTETLLAECLERQHGPVAQRRALMSEALELAAATAKSDPGSAKAREDYDFVRVRAAELGVREN